MKKIFTYLFLIVGTIYLVMSFYLYKYDLKRKGTAVPIVATIEEIKWKEDNKIIILSYEVDGKKYLKNMDYTFGDFVGKKLSLYCNKQDHQDIFGNKFYYLYLITKYPGLFFLLVGITLLSLTKVENYRIKRLKELGILVQAKFEKIEPIKLFGKQLEYPFRIECSWFDSQKNKNIRFVSKIIWKEDNLKKIKKNKLNKFPTYLNPKNYQKYYIDISQIEKD